MNPSFLNNHLSEGLLIQVVDQELGDAERDQAESHLAGCSACTERLAQLRRFSLSIEQAVRSTKVPDMQDVRQSLAMRLQKQTRNLGPQSHPARVMRRFGWGMGIAATLAFGILLVPKHDLTLSGLRGDSAAQTAAGTPSVIEVNGESFVLMPYSNADLATMSPHIVQMQVPVSSLNDVGIVWEPVTNRANASAETERSVLADVLLGADGQPRGVHVLEFE